MVRFLILLLLPVFSFGQIVISADTTINTSVNWGNNIVEIKPGVLISGTGTVNGGYIRASRYQRLFALSLNVNIHGGEHGEMSTAWFGTMPARPDNTPYFQKAINCAINKPQWLVTPAGLYVDSSFLKVEFVYLGVQSGATLKWKGEYTFAGAPQGTVIKLGNAGNYLLGLQMNKGSIIEGISFQGRFVAPTVTGQAYFNLNWGEYLDANGVTTAYLSGIIIDPATNAGGVTGGSSGVTIRNCFIGGFSTAIRFSPLGTQNAEDIIIERIDFGQNRACVLNGQAQEKNNIIRDCRVWDKIHTFFRSGLDGSGGAGNYKISNIDFGGVPVVRLFDIQAAGWFSTFIDKIYAENVGKIGNLLTSGPIISLSESHIDFAFPAAAGNQFLANTNSLNVTFSLCTFRFFGLGSSTQMPFNGLATFDQCVFSGIYTNNVTGSVFRKGCVTFKN